MREAPCAPEGMHDRVSLDPKVLEALTMLPEAIAATPLPVKITRVDGGDEIEGSFLQGIHDLFHTHGCALATTAHLM